MMPCDLVFKKIKIEKIKKFFILSGFTILYNFRLTI